MKSCFLQSISCAANAMTIWHDVLVNPNWTLLLENSQTLQVTDRY
ncbi:hypothetical protein DIKCMJMK_03356 [Shewanella oneidensis]|nr:hypothetical protein [Shewanella oneidensis]